MVRARSVRIKEIQTREECRRYPISSQRRQLPRILWPDLDSKRSIPQHSAYTSVFRDRSTRSFLPEIILKDTIVYLSLFRYMFRSRGRDWFSTTNIGITGHTQRPSFISLKSEFAWLLKENPTIIYIRFFPRGKNFSVYGYHSYGIPRRYNIHYILWYRHQFRELNWLWIIIIRCTWCAWNAWDAWNNY